MLTSPPPHLSPRKRPRQARAAVTLDAIFEATIQVLIADGPRRLTTTRVAERAGVSVGTMYQYFPHKQALFYALNERYLDIVAGIEPVFRLHLGPVGERQAGREVVDHGRPRSDAARRGAAGASGQSGGQRHEDEAAINIHGRGRSRRRNFVFGKADGL